MEIEQEEMQFVAFNLGNEEYAVDIMAVQEIIRWYPMTRVPKAPYFVKGVINLRGTVIPVIDSHLRFNLPPQEYTDESRIIVFKWEDSLVGMTIDHVTEVLNLSPKQIEKPQAVNGIDNQYIKGIGKINGRLLIIMDLVKVLDFGIIDGKE
ncbi:MAG: chemotaxis protein CheW [Peptococcia bacterium]